MRLLWYIYRSCLNNFLTSYFLNVAALVYSSDCHPPLSIQCFKHESPSLRFYHNSTPNVSLNAASRGSIQCVILYYLGEDKGEKEKILRGRKREGKQKNEAEKREETSMKCWDKYKRDKLQPLIPCVQTKSDALRPLRKKAINSGLWSLCTSESDGIRSFIADLPRFNLEKQWIRQVPWMSA